MSSKKVIFISLLFCVVLLSLRFLWLSYFDVPDQPFAKQGVLDLRNYTLTDKQPLNLNGEWEFYPSVFISPHADAPNDPASARQYIPVPGGWAADMSTAENSTFQYGTYRLKILTDDADNRSYGIHVPNIHNSSKLFVNGQQVHTAGQPTTDPETMTRWNVPYTEYFETNQQEIELLIHAANNHFRSGGILTSIKFGHENSIRNFILLNISMELLVCIILIIHMLYALIIYLLGIRQKLVLWFALLVTSYTLTLLTVDSKLLYSMLPLSYELGSRLNTISFLIVSISLFQVIRHLLPEYLSVKAFSYFSIFSGLLAALILLVPFEFYLALQQYKLTTIAIFWPYVLLPILIMRSVIKGKQDVIYLLLASIAVTTSMIGAILNTYGVIETTYYPFEIIIAFLCLATYSFKRYFRMTEQAQQLSAKLQKEDQLKDEFLANTSHEMRNPLHSMINMVQHVLNKEAGHMHQSSRNDMHLIIATGQRMSQLLNDLLDMTLLKENKIHLQISSVRVQNVARGVIDMLRFMADEKKLRFKLEIPHHFPLVEADEMRLTQILFNLLHNAVKYTLQGTITVSADVDNKTALIRIQDTGIGMESHVLAKIFYPYEKGHADLNASSEGIGIGLSVTKQLLELQNGTLSVQSAKGTGSTFIFTLPLAKQSSTHSSVHSMAPQSVWESGDVTAGDGSIEAVAVEDVAGGDDQVGNSHSIKSQHINRQLTSSTSWSTILVVDDDPVNLKIIRNILSSEQLNVLTATNGAEALSLVGSMELDLIITDVMMPQMSGYELVQKIRVRFSISELPILILTARSQPADTYAGFAAGANDYLTKPLNALDLKARVHSLLELKQSINERLRVKAAYLQAQIQPHFLFNTLNSISALIHIDHQKTKELLASFSDYLRLSYDSFNTEKFVSLEHELRLVRAYLQIEIARFGDKLKVIWAVDDQLHVMLPPLCIQPLVENAVRHGLLEQHNGGKLHIQVTAEKDHVYIAISDNGVGMNAEQLDHLLLHKNARGIGLINTDQRLKQLYGRGLEIMSEKGHGTTVSFRVPFEK